MLYELYVENFALIQRMGLKLAPGLNALTGETGAGKSLVIDAVSLLIGARGSDGMIRSGADRALVEGSFLPPLPPPALELLAGEIDPGDTLILSRELVRGSRSVARINGRVVNLNRLRAVGRLLVNIHGQHEHTLLLEEERQRALLDSFGGADCLSAAEAVRQAYAVWRQAAKQVSVYEDDKDSRGQRMDSLQYMIEEIEDAAPEPDELETLRQEAQRLAHGEKLYQYAGSAYDALYGNAGAAEKLNQAAAVTRQAAELDSSLAALAARLSSLYYEAEDAANEINAYRDRVNLDAYRQDEVEARIARLSRLTKKYGGDVHTMLERLREAKDEYARLEEISVSGDQFYRAEREARQRYDAAAAVLSAARARAAERLSAAVSGELKALAMPEAVFRVDLPPAPPDAAGRESALFMIRTNAGEEFQPVARIASGGELSRIVLGIKVILSRLDAVPTLVFDEIDTGLSGRALVSVAERLALVAESAQAITVSHAAVMAAAANHHILVEKHEQEGRTVIAAHPLDEPARIKELARMIAGNKAGAVTDAQAKEMLAQMRRP